MVFDFGVAIGAEGFDGAGMNALEQQDFDLALVERGLAYRANRLTPRSCSSTLEGVRGVACRSPLHSSSTPAGGPAACPGRVPSFPARESPGRSDRAQREAAPASR